MPSNRELGQFESTRALTAARTNHNDTFRTLIESLPDGVIVHADGKIVFVNPSAVRLHRALSPQQLLGRDFTDFIDPGCMPAIRQRVAECLATGQPCPPMESVVRALDGTSVHVDAVASRIAWNDRMAIQVVLRDITKRKTVEWEALASQKRLDMAQKAGLRIGLWDWDVTANRVNWSDETYRQFGFTRETFSGRVEDAVLRLHPGDRERVAAAIRQVLNGKEEEFSAQYRVVRPDGTLCWIDAHGVIVLNGSTHMLGVGVDITNLKEAEESIQKSEQKYRNLFENATYGMFLAKPDGTLLDVNPAMVAMLGYASKQELLARNVERDVYEDPLMRKLILDKLTLQGRARGAEAKWRVKNGKVISVRLDEQAIRDEDGSISHFEVTVEDITERRNLEEQFRQSQKLEAIGLLAGGISHDFNNLLGVILGNTDLLKERTQDERSERHLAAIKKAGTRAADLVRQLLAFSRKQLLYPTLLDLNVVVQDTLDILQRLIGEDVHIETDLAKQLGAVRADRGHP